MKSRLTSVIKPQRTGKGVDVMRCSALNGSPFVTTLRTPRWNPQTSNPLTTSYLSSEENFTSLLSEFWRR